MKKMVLLGGGVLVVTLLAARWAWTADDQPPAPAAPAAPATQPAAKVTDDARHLLDQVAAAYEKLHSLNLAGTITVDLQIEGSDPQMHSASLHSSFVAPNKFRHEVKDDVLVGSTGQMLYTFVTDDNAYTEDEAPKDRVAVKELPRPVAEILSMQDPSLLLAISKSPGDDLLSDVATATKVEDTNVGGVSCPTLKLIQKDKTSVLAMFDPQSYLLRQFQADMTGYFKQRRPDFARAVVTIQYAQSTPDAEEAKDQLFAWSPPPGAKDAAAMASARPLDSADASELEGKPAPQFKLDSLEGKPVSLADSNGKVVLLDFWATWCGPCREALPSIDRIYNEMKGQGLQAYAIDQQEDRQDVADFVAESKLTLPVLLDTEGRVGAQYDVNGIPELVVIGKDGKIKKVFVGFSGDEEAEQLRKIIQDAMKQ